jgi:hypothetical protein
MDFFDQILAKSMSQQQSQLLPVAEIVSTYRCFQILAQKKFWFAQFFPIGN